MTDGPSPAVHVGIVSWNTAELLDRCLAALPAALGGLTARIVVVDNHSADHSVAVAERHPHVTVIRNADNVGYGRAMNQALSPAGAPVLIAINPDTEPGPGSLAALVSVLQTEPDIGLVVPRLLNADGTEQHSVYRFPSPSVASVIAFAPKRYRRRSLGQRFWLEGCARHDLLSDIDWAIGAVHVIRSAALAGQPPYSERWFMYVEDLDLCWRLAQHGWRRRLDGEVAITHVGNAAGSQAWGDKRTARWLRETYDWYRQAKGRSAMTFWALANLTALLAIVFKILVKSLARPSHRAGLSEVARMIPLHVTSWRYAWTERPSSGYASE